MAAMLKGRVNPAEVFPQMTTATPFGVLAFAKKLKFKEQKKRQRQRGRRRP